MTLVETTSAGRPKDVALTNRLLDETLYRLKMAGYSNLRIEQVAAAVGCSKATVYRRWPSRAALTAAALLHRAELGEEPNTGCIVDDLVEHSWQNVENQRANEEGAPGVGSVWAAIVEPDVRDLLWEGFFIERRQRGRSIVARGISRGELPGNTDADAILDIFSGFTLFRRNVRNIALSKPDFRAIAIAIVASPPLAGT